MVFWDIFSKKKAKKQQKQAEIIIDNREKNSMVAANLLGKKAKIKFAQLKIGDYLIGGTVIERKTFSDFISSMISKRLQEQLRQMKKYKNQILIIEGFNYEYKYYLKNENVPRGMILSAILNHKIPIIFTKDEEDTAVFLILLAKRNPKEESLRHTPTFKNQKQQKQFILEGFPNIGPKSAKKLLKQFHTLKEIFNASEEDLKQTIKESKAKSLKEMIEK